MLLDTLPHRFSIVDRLDPRVRAVAGILAALLPIALRRLDLLAATLAVAALLVAYERVALPGLIKRLTAVNGFMLTLFILLPWSVPGEMIVEWGPFTYSSEGMQQALLITLKANAVVLFITAFISTLDPPTFAHALQRLRVPRKLVHLYLFTVRYIAVLEEEYAQLRRAMTVRAFRPRLNAHTFRSLGYLVGMLLVRALDRSERIQNAMRLRGFDGRFHTHRHFRFTPLDAAFALAFIAATTAAVLAEWA